MAAWSGWAGQLLQVLGFKLTTANLKFLNEWGNSEKTGCANNPLSASQSWAGSSSCKGPVRNYRTRADALQAMAAQLHDSKYATILAALKSGDPYAYSGSFAVSQELDAWGSLTFSTKYSTETAQAPTPSTVAAPQTMRGWHSLRHSINHNMPQALLRAAKINRRTLRTLARTHRVKG